MVVCRQIAQWINRLVGDEDDMHAAAPADGQPRPGRSIPRTGPFAVGRGVRPVRRRAKQMQMQMQMQTLTPTPTPTPTPTQKQKQAKQKQKPPDHDMWRLPQVRG
jgi:hypothetical protein